MKKKKSNQFIEQFEINLEKAKNKKDLIENEIYQIKAFTSLPDKTPNFIDELNFANETNSVFDLMDMGNPVYFNSVFNEYLINESVEPILEFKEDGEMQATDDDFLKEEREKAIAFVHYYNWLESLKNYPKTTRKKPSLSHKQKMLALHYLGLDTSQFENKTNLAEVLSKILDLDEGNTRQNLTYLTGRKNEVRTENNLKTVANVFASAGFHEIEEKILSEI